VGLSVTSSGSGYEGFLSTRDVHERAGPILSPLIRAAEPLLKIQRMTDKSLRARAISRSVWLADVAREFQWTSSVTYAGSESELRALPNAIVFANHSLGIRDGHVTLSFMEEMFPNYVNLASTDLRFPSIFDGTRIEVDLHQQKGGNRRAALRAVRAVAEEGRSLFIFPSGRIAQFRIPSMSIEEKPWTPLFLWLARKCNVPLVPLCTHARLSSLSHAIGVVSPTGRLLLNAVEAQSRRLLHVDCTVGRPISPAALAAVGSDEAQLQFLRDQVFQLRHTPRITGAGSLSRAADESSPLRPGALASRE